MNYYPIMLNLENKPILVVGGGLLALQKINGLLTCGAKITVVSPEILDEIRSVADVNLIERKFGEKDVIAFDVIVGATSNRGVNEQVANAGRKHKKLVNIVDMTDLCDYILPSVMRQGKLTIAISTSGAAPFFSKWLGDRFRKAFKEDYATYLEIVEPMRRKVIDRVKEPIERNAIFQKMCSDQVMNYIRQKEIDKAKDYLEEVSGC